MTPKTTRFCHAGRISVRAGVAAVVLGMTLSGSALADFYLPAVGSDWQGVQFMARCAEGELLTGMELRAGDWVDAIRPVCVSAYSPTDTTPPRLTTGSGLIGYREVPMAFGPSIRLGTLEAGWHGGIGGSIKPLLCPRNQPIVTGMNVDAVGRDTMTVFRIYLFCGVADITQNPQRGRPSNEFEGAQPELHADLWDRGDLTCPAGQVAVGIHGRSGKWLNALSLICGEPRLEPSQAKLSRVKLQPGTAGPARPICDVARDARARNSPAAPGLEARCLAEGLVAKPATPPPADLNALAVRGAELAKQDPMATELRNLQPGLARRGFDIGMGTAEGQTEPGPGKQRIHDYLSPVEAEGFATAVAFSLARNKGKLAELAPKGAAVANQDPLAVVLRNQQPGNPARRGFDVGMAAAEGQTEPGPGKDKIRDSLPLDERAGFTTAVTFSLERNRNKAFADRGAAIAKGNRTVATARNAEADAFYRLGFDIATGFFDQQATGPLLKLRDSLSAPVRRGFDASVDWHLRRR